MGYVQNVCSRNNSKEIFSEEHCKQGEQCAYLYEKSINYYYEDIKKQFPQKYIIFQGKYENNNIF